MVRLVISRAAVGLVAIGLGVAVSGEAFAQANVLKECGSRYQAKKAANELAGQSWQDFLKECRASLTQPADAAAPAESAAPAEPAKPAESAAPAPAEPAPSAEPAAPADTAAPPAEPAKPVEAAKPAADTKAATQARQKKCAAEWKAKKAELLKSDKKLTWPKFWSACNKRLKEAGE